MRAAIADPPDPDAIARLSAIPLYNALLRTTCVATMLQAGQAINALPELASAKVNCRIIPGETGDDAARIHGRDERVPVKSLYEGNEYLYRLVKMLAGGA